MTDNIKLLKNYLLYFLLMILICLVGITNVFAWTNWNGITYDEIGAITNKTGIMIEVSYETESGAPLSVSADQLVYTQLKKLYINVDNYNFSANTRYELELYLPNMILSNNANSYIVTGNNGENCLVSYSDAIFVDHYPRWDFQCPTATNTISIVIFNSNNQNITEKNNFSWNYSYLYSSITPITNSGANNNNDLITNANQNADRIIDNQNQNTQDIIDNQNANNQALLDDNKKNFQSCRDSYNLFDKTKGTFNRAFNATLTDDYSNSNWNISDYIQVEYGKTYFISNNNTGFIVRYYDSNKNPIDYFSNKHLLNNLPQNIKYIRFDYKKSIIDKLMVNEGNTQLDYEPYGEEICTNKLDEQTNALNGLNDSLNNDDTTGATSEASNFFNSFNTNTFGLTSIITAPLNLIQSLTSSTCIVLHLPLPYLNNKYLDLPCMTSIYQTHFGSFFTMYQTITYGIIAYWVCVRIFNQVKDFKNPEHDEIEVVDL